MKVLSMDASITGGAFGIKPNRSRSSLGSILTTSSSVMRCSTDERLYCTRNFGSTYNLRNDGVMKLLPPVRHLNRLPPAISAFSVQATDLLRRECKRYFFLIFLRGLRLVTFDPCLATFDHCHPDTWG